MNVHSKVHIREHIRPAHGDEKDLQFAGNPAENRGNLHAEVVGEAGFEPAANAV